MTPQICLKLFLMEGLCSRIMVRKGLTHLKPTTIFKGQLVDIQGYIKKVSFKSDEGALRYGPLKNSKIVILADLSATFTVAPLSSHA